LIFVALSVPELNSLCIKQVKSSMGSGSIPNQIQFAALAITNTLLGMCFVSKCDISMAHTLVSVLSASRILQYLKTLR
jgi:hypothetical protein